MPGIPSGENHSSGTDGMHFAGLAGRQDFACASRLPAGGGAVPRPYGPRNGLAVREDGVGGDAHDVPSMAQIPLRGIVPGLALEENAFAGHGRPHPTGGIHVDTARTLLKLPPHVEPVAFTPLGYPADTPRAKDRKSLTDLVRYELW